MSPVTAAEIRAALRSLKNGHTLGVHSILILIQWLFHIIHQVWIHGELPDNWRWGIILPLWKCKGDKFICSNHGVLYFSQYWESCLLTFFSPGSCLPSIVSANCSKLASCLTLNYHSHLCFPTQIEKAREFCKNHHLFIGFIDLKAVFDSQDHLALRSTPKPT